MSASLKEQTLSGIIWSGLQKSGSLFLGFISSIVLARLLTPQDYGCIGMLAIFIAVSSTFIDGGFGSALIQKSKPTEEDYSTIFIWNLFLSSVLYTILFIGAPSVANFYKTPILSDVLRVQGVILVINALKIIPVNRLRKTLKFKTIAVTEVIVSSISLVITIILAWRGYGVWALVAQQISVSLLSAIMYWYSSKWKPCLRFSRTSLRELFSFGGYLLAANLINTFSNNIQGLLIGRFFNPVVTGYYSKARQTENLASTLVSQIMDQVSYPVLVQAKDNMQMMKAMLKKFIGILAFISFPMMALLILLAYPVFILLYSDTWVESIPYFQILCVGGLAVCLQGINYYAVAAIGKSRDIFKWTFIKRIIGLGLIIAGFYIGGINGLLWGSVMVSHLIYWINAYLCSKYIGYSLKEQFFDLIPIGVVTILSFGITYISEGFLPENIYVKGAIQFVIFCSLYLSLSLLLRIQSFENMREIVKILKKKLIFR